MVPHASCTQEGFPIHMGWAQVTIGRWICKQIQSLGGGLVMGQPGQPGREMRSWLVDPLSFWCLLHLPGAVVGYVSRLYRALSTHPKSTVGRLVSRSPYFCRGFSSFWLNFIRDTTQTLQYITVPYASIWHVQVDIYRIYIYNYAHIVSPLNRSQIWALFGDLFGGKTK